jgi:hypothetical protein
MMSESIYTINKTKEPLLATSKETDLKVSAEKTKCMFMAHEHSAGQSQKMKVDNKSFESAAKFTYLRTTLKNQHCIHEEIMSRLNSGKACHHLFKNLLSSSLRSKNIKVKTHKTIILPVVLAGCDTWSLILREKHRLRMFKNSVQRKISGPTKEEVTGDWRQLHNKKMHELYSPLNTFQVIKSRRDGQGM